MINGFEGQYRFLSNFYERRLNFCGKYYATSEHAYQAFKATTEEDHELVRLQTSPRMTKKYGGEIKIRADWEDIKYDLMLEIVREKFKDPYLKNLLEKTGDKYLEETNWWHDNTWGNCTCGRDKCKDEGKNYLGKILMKIRKENRNDNS